MFHFINVYLQSKSKNKECFEESTQKSNEVRMQDLLQQDHNSCVDTQVNDHNSQQPSTSNNNILDTQPIEHTSSTSYAGNNMSDNANQHLQQITENAETDYTSKNNTYYIITFQLFFGQCQEPRLLLYNV